MSAFMCSEIHIAALVTYASAMRVTYYYKGETHHIAGDEQRTALILQAANSRSVNYRYAHNPDALDESEPIKYRYLTPRSALGTIKLCHCFDYQSCEPPSWDESEAKAITGAILGHATHTLPGYDAEPWSI